MKMLNVLMFVSQFYENDNFEELLKFVIDVFKIKFSG